MRAAKKQITRRSARGKKISFDASRRGGTERGRGPTERRVGRNDPSPLRPLLERVDWRPDLLVGGEPDW